MNKGAFIVFEGGEGSGKGANLKSLQAKYADRDDIVFTREPGGTSAGEKIRGILLEKTEDPIDFKTEFFLFLAARSELLAKVVIPALQQGKTVVSDRFFLSTIAYQIYARQHKECLPLMQPLNRFILGEWMPDAHILLDVPPAIGLARAKSRNEETTRLDEESLEFHKRVRSAYLDNITQVGVNYVVDASYPLEQVQKQVGEIFARYYR